MHNILHKRYYNIEKSERYIVQRWSQTKSSRIKLLEVHGVSKDLDPNIQLDYKTLKRKQNSQEKPRIGQGRAGMRTGNPPINQPISQSAEPSKKIPEVTKIEKKVINQPDYTTPEQSINNSSMEVINRRMV